MIEKDLSSSFWIVFHYFWPDIGLCNLCLSGLDQCFRLHKVAGLANFVIDVLDKTGEEPSLNAEI